MNNNAAVSIAISRCALALGALSACSDASTTGFGTPDAAALVITGLTAGSSGPSASSGTGSGNGSTVATSAVATSAVASSAIASTTVASSAASTSSTTESSASTTSASTSHSTTAGSTGDPEPADMVGMTAAHNSARAAVQPAATPPLPTMAWSSTIAASAQAFTTQCVFADTMDQYGSNAFAGTGTYKPSDVVDSWVGEDADYDYATNTCEAGQMCGHYTQVVWRDSIELGCGMTNCTKNNPFGGSGAWQLWVCNYSPPGNYVGEKPY